MITTSAAKTYFREMFGIKLKIGKEFSLSECNPLPTYEDVLEDQEMGVDR